MARAGAAAPFRGEGPGARASAPARWEVFFSSSRGQGVGLRISPLRRRAESESTKCGNPSHGESRVGWRPVGPGWPGAHGEYGRFPLGLEGGVGVTQRPAPARTLERRGPPPRPFPPRRALHSRVKKRVCQGAGIRTHARWPTHVSCGTLVGV